MNDGEVEVKDGVDEDVDAVDAMETYSGRGWRKGLEVE